MKKYLLITALAFPLSASTAFNGFYVGAMGGFVQNTLNSEISARGSTWKAKSQKSPGFSYGIFGGYGQNINSVYLGMELGIHTDTASKDRDYTFAVNGKDHTLHAKYQRGPVLSLAPRLGIVFCNSYMAYIKPAIEISRDKIVDSDDGRDSTKTKTISTFVPSVGLEKAFNNVLLRVEYSYNFGKKWRLSEDGTVKDGNTTKPSIMFKYTSQAIKFGLGYKF